MSILKRIKISIAVLLASIFVSISLVDICYALGFNGITMNYSYPMRYQSCAVFSSGSKTGQKASVAKWNSASEVTNLFIAASEHYLINYPANDGINRIYSIDMHSSTIVAQNTMWFRPGTFMVVESDINYNSGMPLSNGAVPGRYDVETAFLHELGHTVGIADSYAASDSKAVMYGYISPGVTKRTLSADDKYLAYERYH